MKDTLENEQANLADLQSTATAKSSTLQNLTEPLTGWNNQIFELEKAPQQLSDAQAVLSSAQTSYNSAKQAADDANSKLGDLKNKKIAADNKVSAADSALKSANAKVTEAQNKLQTAKDNLNKVEEQERKRQAELEKEREEIARQEAQRKAEEEARKQAEAEAARKAEEEKERQEAEQKAKEQAEAAREAAKKQQEAELAQEKAEEEAKKQAEAEAARKAEEERGHQEAEQKAKEQEETKSINLTHNAYVYDKDGNAIKVNSENKTLYKGDSISALSNAKVVTINGKDYYQIGENEFVKVANTVEKEKAAKKTTVPKSAKLTHNAFVYDKNGKRVKLTWIKRGSSIKPTKIVTIKGKKYYQIGKNKFVKVANTKVKTNAVKKTATIKAKLNHKVATYDRSGKKNGHHVLGMRTYNFNEKKTINGKTYYKISGKNDWLPASKLSFK